MRHRYGQWQEDGRAKETSDLEFYEYVEALKLTGDPYVPAGQVKSFFLWTSNYSFLISFLDHSVMLVFIYAIHLGEKESRREVHCLIMLTKDEGCWC